MDTREGPGSYGGGGFYGGGRRDRGAYEDSYHQPDSSGDGYRGGRGGRGGYRGGGGGGRHYQYHHDSHRGGYGGGFHSGGYHDGGRGGGRGYYDSSRGGGRSYRGRGGRADWGGQRGPRHDRRGGPEPLPDDIALLTELTGHTKAVHAMVFDASSNQLYTGSYDGTVRVWSCVTGECTSSVDVGGEVDSLLMGGGFLIVGLHNKQEGLIKVWNMGSGSQHTLTGHRGQVVAMAVANSLLFSGGQDASVRVWSFNAAAGIFMSQAILTADQGGHKVAVTCLTSHGNYLFSGDREGTIKVWDLTSGANTQTVSRAHQEAAMQLLVWENFMLSASLDGSIQVRQFLDPPAAGMVLKPEADFTFTREDDGQQQRQQQRQRGPHSGSGGGGGGVLAGVLTMYGTADPAGNAVLLVSYNGEPGVYLYELPSFKPRGILPDVTDARCMATVAGSVIITGDSRGRVKVFQWKPQAGAAAGP